MEKIKLFELAERYHKLFPKEDIIATQQKNGVMRKYSTIEYIETTNNIGYGLLNIGCGWINDYGVGQGALPGHNATTTCPVQKNIN